MFGERHSQTAEAESGQAGVRRDERGRHNEMLRDDGVVMATR